MTPFWKASLLAIVGSTIANLIVLFLFRSSVIDPAMPLASLAVVPVVTLTVIGAIAAIIVYAVLRKYAQDPARIFIRLSVIAFVLSLAPDYLIMGATTGHFAGATSGAVLVLMLMHAVAAVIIVWSLVSFWKR